MKCLFRFFSCLTALMLLTCCSDDFMKESGNYVKSISATIEQIPETIETRANVLIEDKKFKTYWEAGDELGIYPIGGDQVKFPISSTNDENPGFALFDGGSWALRSEFSYAAYFPYDVYNCLIPQTEIPFSYEGQRVNALNDFSHMGDYAFMAAAATRPNSNGGVNLEFKHIGCFVRLSLTIKETTTLKSIKLSCDDALFVVKGTCDLTNSGDPYLTPTSDGALHEYTLGVNNVDVTANQVAYFWLMLHPVDLSGKTLKIKATNTKDEEYEGSVDGQKMVRLGASNYVLTLSKKGDSSGTGGSTEEGEWNEDEVDTTPYVTFHADGAQTLKMSKEVPSLEYSVNDGEWATLGTTQVAFGGTTGDLRLRGKSSYGTATSSSAGNSATIQFSTNVAVAASGDIRTLVNYESYQEAESRNAKFCRLFYGCSVLTSGPELPATTLADNCYFEMFAYCSSLSTAPALPATTLSRNCYQHMFQNCNVLSSAPVLPATNLNDYCYAGMFTNCELLSEAPTLSATTMKMGCYAGMFSGCTSLVAAPALPSTTLASDCYSSMFSGCTSLTNAPSLPATSIADFCYDGMFKNCIALTTAPELKATVMATRCYGYMFMGCTSLKEAPALPATTLASQCYTNMFTDCSSLEEAPALPATTLAEYCYVNMFLKCTSLKEAPALPATILARECYQQMFGGCTSLTASPILLASTLTINCYRSMFSGCSSMTTVKMLATNISASDALQSWLYYVGNNGTFYKNVDATWDNEGVIPKGWTVKYLDAEGNEVSKVIGNGNGFAGDSDWNN